MAGENVIDTLVVRLIGDANHYKKTMQEASQVAKKTTKQVNNALQDASGYWSKASTQIAQSQATVATSAKQTANAVSASTQKMAAATEQFAAVTVVSYRDVSGRLRDARGRFIADGNAIAATSNSIVASVSRIGFSLQGLGRQAGSALSSVRGSLASLSQGLSSVYGQALTAVGATSIGALLYKTVSDASDAGENLAKFNAVFGKEAQRTSEFVTKLADDIGRSDIEIRKSISAFNSIFVGLGFGGGTAADMSMQLQRLALDFAAFHNTTDDEAMQRFISAMSGSAEVLDQFGVNIRQGALEQELLAMGINKSVHEATEAEKTMARLNVIMGVMAGQGAIGAASRESESFANRLKDLKAEALDLSVKIGNDLMPMAKELIAWLKDLTQTASEGQEGVGGIASAFLQVADVLHTVALGFQMVQSWITSTVATAASALDRLSNPTGVSNTGPLGKAGGIFANAGVKSALGPLGLLLPGAKETGAYADTLGAEADIQYNEYQKALMAQTPSERYAQRQAEEANKPKEEIDRDFTRMTMAESFDNLLMKGAMTFGSTVADYGELFALKADNAFTGIWADATNLYNTPQQVDSFNKATAGSAVAFGSAESEISQRSKTDSSLEKNTEKLVINAEANKRLNEKIATATEGIFQSIGAAISIPY